MERASVACHELRAGGPPRRAVDFLDCLVMLSTTPDKNKWESTMPAFVWEINFALWIMIGCAAMKVTHLVQYLTN